MNATLGNIIAIARREYLWRGRTRTFVIVTALLMIVAFGVSLAPIAIRWAGAQGGPARIGLFTGDSKPGIDVGAALDGLLNASTGSGGGSASSTPAYAFATVPSVDEGRAEVSDGKLSSLLVVARDATGDLGFTLYSKGQSFERSTQLIQQATTAIAIQDRLARAGIPQVDQARLFAPSSFSFQSAGSGGGGPGTASDEAFANSYIMGFALQLFIFMAIMLYGQWVAMSVAEEKSSRVMEVVLGAATPFQLLAGKVAGVGLLGLTQYVLVFVPAALGIVFQDRIAAFVLGGTSNAGLPAGLSVPLLAAFGLFFVLGFALYAVLYAAAASLVSRQEDVNQIVAPMTMLSVAGYMVGVYSGTGLIDLSGSVLGVLSVIPFLSPYLMLSRIALGTATPVEVLVAVVLLVASVPVALWIAARIYAAGVLLYGQKPNVRTMLRALRSARA